MNKKAQQSNEKDSLNQEVLSEFDDIISSENKLNNNRVKNDNTDGVKSVKNNYRKKPFINAAISDSESSYLKIKKAYENALEHPYIKGESILTNAEKRLYNLMLSTLNRYLRCTHRSIVIFPKIRIADIIDVNPILKNRKEFLYQITNKHIDYIIADSESLELVCAVELDDFYHNQNRVIERDRFVNNTLRDCGIQLFRVDVPIETIRESDIINIVEYVLDSYAPICSECGCTMHSMKSRRGHRFYGCDNWLPDRTGCNFTIDIN